MIIERKRPEVKFMSINKPNTQILSHTQTHTNHYRVAILSFWMRARVGMYIVTGTHGRPLRTRCCISVVHRTHLCVYCMLIKSPRNGTIPNYRTRRRSRQRSPLGALLAHPAVWFRFPHFSNTAAPSSPPPHQTKPDLLCVP